MCKPASFIATKDKVYFGRITNSHAQILEQNSIEDKDLSPDFVKVEISPPFEGGKYNFNAPFNLWTFRVDQDFYPDWFLAELEEKRCREKLQDWYDSHIKGMLTDCSKMFFTAGHGSILTAGDESTLTAGDRSTLKAGYGSILTAGHESTLKAGDESTLTAGCGSTLTAGDESTLTAGDESTLKAGDKSTLTSGDRSTLKAGHESALKAGDGSTLTAGYGSTLKAGHGSTLKAGRGSILTAGNWSMLTAGDGSTLKAGRGSVFIGRFRSKVSVLEITEEMARKTYKLENGIWNLSRGKRTQ